jgi:hypothetical protein
LFFYDIKFCDLSSFTILPALSCNDLGISAGKTIPEEVLPSCFLKFNTMFVSSCTFFKTINRLISLASSGVDEL